jgi:hypothetical protein
MSGDERDKVDWERIFAMKRHLSDLMKEHTLADVMAREKSPYLATEPGKEGNRQQRRAAARKARR